MIHTPGKFEGFHIPCWGLCENIICLTQQGLLLRATQSLLFTLTNHCFDMIFYGLHCFCENTAWTNKYARVCFPCLHPANLQTSSTPQAKLWAGFDAIFSNTEPHSLSYVLTEVGCDFIQLHVYGITQVALVNISSDSYVYTLTDWVPGIC